MPSKPGHPCRAPGCVAIVAVGAWCDAHKPPEKPRASTRRIYNRSWEKIRAATLARSPLCVHCEREGRVTAATEVDHITPLSKGGTHASANLQTLCKSCHSRKTRGEQG